MRLAVLALSTPSTQNASQRRTLLPAHGCPHRQRIVGAGSSSQADAQSTRDPRGGGPFGGGEVPSKPISIRWAAVIELHWKLQRVGRVPGRGARSGICICKYNPVATSGPQRAGCALPVPVRTRRVMLAPLVRSAQLPFLSYLPPTRVSKAAPQRPRRIKCYN